MLLAIIIASPFITLVFYTVLLYVNYARHQPRHYRFLLTGYSRLAKDRLVSHRGFGKKGPVAENTLPAFTAAIKKGFKLHEMDVRTSADHIPVLFHGPQLQSTTSGRGRLEKKLLKDLATLDWGYYLNKNENHVPYGITTLEAYLKEHGSTNIQNIELKRDWYDFNARLESAVVATVQRLELEPRTFFSSFNLSTLRRLKKISTMGTGLLVEPGRFLRLRLHFYLRFTRPDYVHLPDENTSRSLVRALKKKGYGLLVYTVNETKRARELFSMGIDLVCTDNIAMRKKF